MLYSIGDIAKQVGATHRHINWAAKAAGIEPTMIAGGIKLFDTERANKILERFRAIRASNVGRPRAAAKPPLETTPA